MNKNNNNQKALAFSFLFAAAGTLCFPQILNQKENTLVFNNSILAVFVWLACFYFIYFSLRTLDLRDRRGWFISFIFSFLFTVSMLFGSRLDYTGSVNFKDWKLWVSLPVLTCLFAVIVRYFWSFLCQNWNNAPALSDSTYTQVLSRNILTFMLLILCWLPVLLAVYPGFFVYDAQDEWVQVASRNFNTHHPLVHTLMLGGIICAVNKFTGSYNLGILCYIIIQMTIISCVFTHILSYMRRKGVSRIIRVLSLLYFCFFPVIVMFTLCSAKDALFTASLLMLLLSLLEMCTCGGDFFYSKRKQAAFVLSAAAMILLRKNGIYAFVLLVPFLLIFNKKNAKKLSLLILTALISFFIIDGGLTAFLHADGIEKQEMLTLPIQQLARTYKFNPEAFGPEDIAALREILPEEALALYRPKLSDPVKARFNNAAYMADKEKYARLWLRIGLRKPLSYINAWLANSYGFWYPDTVIDVYSGNTVFTFTYGDSSYFGYEVEHPGVRESKIPWLDEFYRKLSLEISKEKIPLYSMLYSPGAMFWLFAFVLSFVLYRKKYHLAVPCLIVLFIWFTVIIGPTYLPRYVLILWYGLPLFVAMLTDTDAFSYTHTLPPAR